MVRLRRVKVIQLIKMIVVLQTKAVMITRMLARLVIHIVRVRVRGVSTAGLLTSLIMIMANLPHSSVKIN